MIRASSDGTSRLYSAKAFGSPCLIKSIVCSAVAGERQPAGGHFIQHDAQ